MNGAKQSIRELIIFFVLDGLVNLLDITYLCGNSSLNFNYMLTTTKLKAKQKIT
jgi:hypothetical protein